MAQETPLIAAAEADNDRDHRNDLPQESLFEVVALLRPGHLLTIDLWKYALVFPTIYTEFIIINEPTISNDGWSDSRNDAKDFEAAAGDE